jgi:hypothetical protein
MTSPWTKESEEFLMRLYHQGATGGEIAKAIANEYGFKPTRNAIIGKIHRVLARDNKPRFAKPAEPKVPKQAKVEPAKDAEALRYHKPTNPEPLKHYPRVQTQASVKGVPQGPLCYDIHERATCNSVELMELQPYHCRFPLENEQGRTLYCGHEKSEGSSYCEHHKRRCQMGRVPVSSLFKKPRRFEGGRFGF